MFPLLPRGLSLSLLLLPPSQMLDPSLHSLAGDLISVPARTASYERVTFQSSPVLISPSFR